MAATAFDQFVCVCGFGGGIMNGGWRLAEASDIPFVYELVTKVDPRWWRFSRGGLEPSVLLSTAQGISAGVIVVDSVNNPVACAILADAGTMGTGMFEYYALPNPQAEALARRFAPELLAAAFAGAPIRRLYYERFENDAEVFGELSAYFEVEVTYPEFAMIDGRYESRTTSVLTLERFTESQLGAAQ
ncbi:MAG: hypothetical protein K8R99_05290 [Actinomycetia bacterium]|nr:hypothetical protein [Actinomycetes bacterium]